MYQVGLLLYRAVNGDAHYRKQVPNWSDLPSMVIKGRFPDRRSFLPHVPARIRTIIRTALHKDFSKRYGSAAEMSIALGPRFSWPTIGPFRRTQTERAGRPSRKAVRRSKSTSGTTKKNGWRVEVVTKSVQHTRACERTIN